ncbi:MAG: FKBP-type peptidyl-prolyl cis-trans isomerase [Pyrinomonadaceae bacterium]
MPQSRKRHTAGRSHTRRTSYGAQERSHARHAKQKRTRVIAAVIIVALLAGAAAYLLVPKLPGGAGAEVTTASGLKYTDLVVGTGASPRAGQTVVVHYTGTLPDGTQFDSSRDKGQPYSFVLRSNPPSVIKGWDEGVATMKVGGRRQLVVPPVLGYGAIPRTGIPANSTLFFDVELLDVK